jgi:ribose transport system permease protein
MCYSGFGGKARKRQMSDASTSPIEVPPDAPRHSRRALAFLQYRSLIVLVMMFIAATLLSPVFLTPVNLSRLVSQNSIPAVLAVGVTFAILSGGIDLSVGSVMLCAGVVTAGLLRAEHVAPWIAALACVSIGSGLGLVNGILVAYLRLPAFIATLAMMVGAVSMGQLYSQGSPIIIGEDKMPGLVKILDSSIFAPPPGAHGNGVFPGVPVSGIVFAFVAFAAWVLLARTRYGRYVYALGGNREATRLSGINVRLIEASVYVVSGTLAGVAALIYTARQSSGQAVYGGNYELNAIAAAVIGGASLMGGEGTIGGAIVGVLFVGMLNNLMQLRNQDSYQQGGILALAIILGVLIQIKRKK